MANISPATQAIDSIAQCLANASEAVRRLDSAVSNDLRSLLRLAGGEAERVRKAARKASPSKKPTASKSAKSPAKRAPIAKVAPQQGKSRRRAVANGAAAH
jgi:hypothetical protein